MNSLDHLDTVPRIPDHRQALDFFEALATQNAGPWVSHSRCTADTCRALASALCAAPGHGQKPDAGMAWILGLLHDVGRSVPGSGMGHICLGHDMLLAQGWLWPARAAITHSFVIADPDCASGSWLGFDEDRARVATYLEGVEYTIYDRILHMADALSGSRGPQLLEVRLVDIAMRNGIQPCTQKKWQALFELKKELEAFMAVASIYEIVHPELGLRP